MGKILIVDDQQKIRNMLRRHLIKAGYEVLEAESGEQAIQELKEILPDVVLLDIMMPGLSGFEVCERLRSVPQGDLIYIIMLTGAATDEQKVRGLDLGADDYVTKPFNLDELLARIRVGIRTVQKKRDAVIDPLTKLYNRNFFNAYFAQEVSKALRYQRQLSLILADLDHFKHINDTYGHLVGDGVLAETGNILRQYCRQSDTPVRWGGEEFAILLPETDVSGGRILAERIRQAIESHTFPEVEHITASFGVANLTTTAEELIQQADEALYQAKNSGRNRVNSTKEHA